MKTIITILLLFIGCSFSNAQIFGSNDVCSGYTYSYTATISGAVTYSWSFPPGWYDLSGQGTGSITVTCNENIGDIYCEGLDAVGNSIATLVLVTQFGGGGGSGWDVQPSSVSGCNGMPFTVSVVPNGTGGGSCPAGCGNGTLHGNIHYALYNNTWPLGYFIGFADGIYSMNLGLNVSPGPAYVYQVDVTDGYDPPQAVRILGDCGGGTVNNVCMITIFLPMPPSFSQIPLAPCIGDTVSIYETSGISNPCWGCSSNISGLNVIGSAWTNPLVAIVTNSTPTADVTGIGINGCLTYDIYNVNTTTCAMSSLTGDTIVCSGSTYGNTVSIPGAVTYTWSLPVGWYNIMGQGSANVTATCNVNSGNICVEGFDASNNSVGTVCLITQFGGGVPVGWDVQPQNSTACVGDPYALNIVPNGSGSGSCPNSCGSGTPIINIAYAVYDNVWPSGNFVGFANGSSLSVPAVPGSYTYYIYNIDYTNGTSTSQAVRIEGGCGTATVNNIVQLNIPYPIVGFMQNPDPACIGDTVTVWEGTGSTNGSYVPIMGITILSQGSGYMTAVINSMPARALYTGVDINGCSINEICYIIICPPAALTGDTTVCAGYSYTYTANIAGAVSYTWLLPTGWYGITGQGTATIVATCNVNDGWISVSGLDSSGNIVGAQDVLTNFGGGGGTGWDVQPSTVSGCAGFPFSISVMPNGTGGGPGCPPGCGNGTLHPNLVYALYDNVWPFGIFMGYTDGASLMYLGGFGGPAYVYYVDISLGLNPPQAIKIEGGCGGGMVNNICIIAPLIPNPPVVTQTPMPACIGDTVQLFETSGLLNVGWGFTGTNDLTLVSPQYSNPLIVVVTGSNPYTDVTGVDAANGCSSFIPYLPIAITTCAVLPSAQVASSDTVFCDKQSINFTDLSTNNPTSWQWFFAGAQPDTSTAQNPQGIYYPTYGTFDVTLIACNAAGCDTITLNNFIVEYLTPTDSIFELNDTLFSFPAITYQWYEVGTGLIVGATNQYYVPLQNGNYYCLITDSIGCSGPSNTIAITTGLHQISNFQFPISITPNPNNGIFSLELNSTSKIKNLKTQILNVLGEIVFEKAFENVNGKFSQQINLSNEQKGIYVLKLMSDEKVFAQKIIVD